MMIKEFDEKCIHTVECLDHELLKIRTGRAHPGLLDNITVSAYGQPTALKQLATVSVADARTLHVTPWDKGVMNAIVKAIQESDLGLNPTTQADKLLVPMPTLTEERRKDLVKVVRHEGERCKVTLRHHRRDILNTVKHGVKQKEMTEDDEKRTEHEVDKLVERYSKIVDTKIGTKEKELLSV